MPYNYRKKIGGYSRTQKQKYVARMKNKRYSAKRYSTIEKVLKSLPKDVKNRIKRFTGTRKYTNRRGAIQRRRKEYNYYKKRVLAKNPKFAIKERGPRYPINKRIYNRLTLKKHLKTGLRNFRRRLNERKRVQLKAKKNKAALKFQNLWRAYSRRPYTKMGDADNFLFTKNPALARTAYNPIIKSIGGKHNRYGKTMIGYYKY